MAPEKPPSGPSDKPRRRRASTIDLQATEIASDPVRPTPENVAEPVVPPSRFSAETHRRPESTASPEHDPFPQPQERPHGGSESSARRRYSIAWLPPNIPWPLVGAGAAGAAVVLIPALLLLWLAGAWQRPPDPSDVLQPRLTAIETQLRALASRPLPPAIDPQSIEAMASRITRLEAAGTAAPRAQPDSVVLNRLTANEDAVKVISDRLDNRLAAAENAVKSLADQVTALGKAVEAAAGAARESKDLAQTATATASTAAQSSVRTAVAANDREVRLALAAEALRAALERGDPFAEEWAAAKSLGADQDLLQRLEPFAATGVPGRATLGRELSALVPRMLDAARLGQGDSGLLGRLQANAQRLVRIRPVDSAPGDDPVTVRSRAESKAAHADIARSLDRPRRSEHPRRRRGAPPGRQRRRSAAGQTIGRATP
jgi:hypothetical protein